MKKSFLMMMGTSLIAEYFKNEICLEKKYIGFSPMDLILKILA